LTRLTEIIDSIEGMSTRDILKWLAIEDSDRPHSFMDKLKMEREKGYFWYYIGAIIIAAITGFVL
jgi:hypothetical protein